MNQTIKQEQTKVICNHYGGVECEDCKFNHITNGYLGKKFYCENAMNDMSGDIVELVQF